MSNCRICESKIKKIIDFGKIALVGNFSKKKGSQKKYKISLNYCVSCKHVQISEKLNPNLLFKNYLWETGISESNIHLLKNFLQKLKKFGINKKSKVLEIASNDGSFIKILKEKFNCFVIGVDPAKNLAKKANKKSIFTINNYFDYKLSYSIKQKYKRFDYIFARNVIAHIKQPNNVFKGIENLLKDNGIFVLEVPHLLNILSKNQYDNIFHEHIGFHSLKSIQDLCKINNLKVFDIEKIDSQGGSMRCFISKQTSNQIISRKIKLISKKEKNSSLFLNSNLKNFKNKILKHSESLHKLIEGLKSKKKKYQFMEHQEKDKLYYNFQKWTII